MTFEELSDVKDKVSTPAYVFDKLEFTNRAVDIREKVGKEIGICFSIKANPFLTDAFFESSTLFDKFEVCSIGELRICKENNVDPNKILFSGINKCELEIEEAYEYGVRLFTIESINHLQYIGSVGSAHNDRLPVLIRISADSQFGIDESEVINIIENRDQYSSIDIVGIHYFTGTQKKSYGIINKELEYLAEFCQRMKETYHFMIKNVEYGTGLGVDYFVDQKSAAVSIEEIIPSLISLSKVTNLTIEMGRFFAATCGYYFTKIVDSKTNNGTNYAIVDGGMNQLHYDGQIKSMKIPHHVHIRNTNTSDSKKDKWIICGSICSTEDVICRDVEYDGLEEGDILVFKNCGAYSFMEAMSTFLSREMPQIWAIGDNREPVLMRDFIFTESYNRRTAIVKEA